MKKLISLLLSVLMLFTSFGFSSNAFADAVYKRGQNVPLTIYAYNNKMTQFKYTISGTDIIQKNNSSMSYKYNKKTKQYEITANGKAKNISINGIVFEKIDWGYLAASENTWVGKMSSASNTITSEYIINGYNDRGYEIRIDITGTNAESKSNMKMWLKGTATIPKTKIKSVSSPKSGQLKVSWKKVATNCDGYVIQYSQYSDFKNSKYVLISSKNKTSYTIKNLIPKKKYYVKMRTYKILKGEKPSNQIGTDTKTEQNIRTYSLFSNIKSKTVKK